VELLGPYGLEVGLLWLSKTISSLNSGIIANYALYILIGLIFYNLIPYFYYFDNSIVLLVLLSTIPIVLFKII
jgi:NADH-ubiquinone oxidoreductase chain 5